MLSQSRLAASLSHRIQDAEKLRYCYSLYGVTLRSQYQLPYPAAPEATPPVVELLEGSRETFEQAAQEVAGQPPSELPVQFTRLADGWGYLRWAGLYYFLVSPGGGRILGHPAHEGIALESFHGYLLSVALSFPLIQLGADPLHATAVAANGSAFGLLGKSGYGKSSLAAAFLKAGYPVVTDDLLVLREEQGLFLAHPGPPRLKLQPEVAAALFGEHVQGVPMNPLTRKLILPLTAAQSVQRTVPLKTLYVLNRPSAVQPRGGQVGIRRLSSRRALVVLLEQSFNDWITEPGRLHAQFLAYARIASRVPVKLISYPRRMEQLGAVRDAILEDLAR